MVCSARKQFMKWKYYEWSPLITIQWMIMKSYDTNRICRTGRDECGQHVVRTSENRLNCGASAPQMHRFPVKIRPSGRNDGDRGFGVAGVSTAPGLRPYLLFRWVGHDLSCGISYCCESICCLTATFLHNINQNQLNNTATTIELKLLLVWHLAVRCACADVSRRLVGCLF